MLEVTTSGLGLVELLVTSEVTCPFPVGPVE